MNLNSAFDYAKSHPAIATIGVVIVGGGLFLILRGSGGGGGGASDPNVAAYYNAQAAQAASGNSLMAAQINAQASTTQALAADASQVTINQTWADSQLAQTNSNNAAATSVAPYAVENNLISTLGAIATLPPTVSTSTSTSKGFFGIGGGTKSGTTVTPNPEATGAEALLAQFSTGLFAGH